MHAGMSLALFDEQRERGIRSIPSLLMRIEERITKVTESIGKCANTGKIRENMIWYKG